ncbi:hypothetical protein DI272_09865 [Streptomyces sp. Act143]|uniref:hypothetical protein n=1 Tax=Streptomyces sp. Act143 TaxID=2200760 RepID=UPI000D6802D3|nr:hypothetical protein [Streptomyces sp. Act143]PWI14425.1 hypothetical protein DI272_09865 [Streptomyces sp. Act143]
MDEQHLLNGLMKAVGEEQSEYVVRPFFPGMKKFAAFAYVAERFGYRYMGHAPGNAALNNPYFLFQRTPDARERAAATMAGHPGGRVLPGMRPGRGLTPDASAQPEVDLLYSQMIVDACGRYNPRVLSNILLFPVVAAIFLIFPGYTTGRVVIAGGIWVVLIALYLVGLAVTRYRRAKHAARLSAAGVEWPPRAVA